MTIIIDNIINDWWDAKDNAYLKAIMHKYSSLNRILFYMILTPLLLYIFKISSERIPYTTMIDNITVLIRTTPVSSECWNYADAPIIIYITRFVSRIIECCIYNIASGGVDLYFFVIAMHICGQVEIISSRFQKFHLNNQIFDRNKLLIIINRQKCLLELIDCLLGAFEFLMLVVLLSSTIQLNVIGNCN